MSGSNIVSQHELITILDNAGQAIWTYFKYIIIGLVFAMAAKTYAKNIWTRTRMLLSGMHGCRKDDMIQDPPHSGKFYIVEEITWFNGKITLGNPDDTSDVIYKDIQSYWSGTIQGRRPSNLHENKKK